ncbi:MAG: lamin tail domain-containing protein [Phycisphaerales bacterium]|nr:lamin tail domain-containing protein [Phycisphaerales bacterium]
MKKLIVVSALLALTGAASAQVRITEWMYSGNSGEYIEITNIGGSAVSMAGWSFDDDSRLAGTIDLSGLGTLKSGESAIITEITAGEFRTNWSLGPWVKIVELNIANLGRNDEINIFDASAMLADRLTYGDQNISGSIRTQNKSGSTPLANLGANNVLGWTLAANGDSYGSYTSDDADIGNPGEYAPIPAPGVLAFGLTGLGLAARRKRA